MASADSLRDFHPLLQTWFRAKLGAPTPAQVQAWPRLQAGEDVLVCAPTGSGKTLAAFLSILDTLVREALAGQLTARTRVVYVSPLRALSNDVQKNLLRPIAEMRELGGEAARTLENIRVGLRTGDSTPAERASLTKHPPHILVTTPESLYLCLTSRKMRERLRDVETVIVDELHALARDKRGSHLTLSLERLEALAGRRVARIGLSATLRPTETFAAYLCGPHRPACARVEVGHQRPWELSVETPDEALSQTPSDETWGLLYARLVELSAQHRTTLVFVNTRRLAERVAHDLGERLGEGTVCAHHGSMSRELRLHAEERLKKGELRVMVATASLELGIDIGAVDLVCQLGSPRSIAALLQRVGRAGHQVGGISRGILFALTLDELVEATALVRAVQEGLLDRVIIPEEPLDILAQQVVAACACEEWEEQTLFELVVRAWPYRALSRARFEQVLNMLAHGPSPLRSGARAHLHWDRVNGRLRGRRGAALTALTNGGAIPETFSYPVVALPDARVVGTLDEEFAIESTPGDVFLLGSTSWRLLGVSEGKVHVEDAHGAPPSAPLWRGEAPARTQELSFEVGRLREDVVADPGARGWLQGELGLAERDAEVLERYLRASAAALGAIPSARTVVAERFFDEAGGMQLILHAPFGARINRAFGLALRKRFCKTFDFELQAVATDDGVLLSLGEQHAFPLADIFEFLSASSVERVLVQAVLQVPLFGTRFRWNATRALALARFLGGKRVPPQLQRSRAEDLLASIFPAQVGCQDNHGGEELIPPEHPLVDATLYDCLHEAMDVEGLREVLRGIKEGRIRTVAQDTPEPSPLAHALVSAHPGAFLDEAPAEERRTRAVYLRRGLPDADALAFGALDAEAIRQVVEDAQPLIRDADELHEALVQGGVLSFERSTTLPWRTLVDAERALWLEWKGCRFLVARERLRALGRVYPHGHFEPGFEPLACEVSGTREEGLQWLVRGWMETAGPITVSELGGALALPVSDVEAALISLEGAGQVLRGRFRPERSMQAKEREWCDRRLLRRIHALTVGRLRRDVEPLHAQDFMRFLLRWHHLDGKDGLRGRQGLLKALSLLEGYEAPVSAWESALLKARMHRLEPELLERACWDGEAAWGRLSRREARPGQPAIRRGGAVPKPVRGGPPSLGRSAPITFVRREQLDWMLQARSLEDTPELKLSQVATEVREVLLRRGAVFFAELLSATRRLPSEVEDALWELVGAGEVTADALDNLRVLQSPEQRRRQRQLRRGGPGRWSLLRPQDTWSTEDLAQARAELFLRRYGILWRDLLVREPLAPSWRELLAIYRRMEARGELRGGRFVSGFTGEQFALPEALELARAVRRTPTSGVTVHVAAVDPVNLTGVVTPGPRIPAVPGNVVTFVDGVPRSALEATV